MQRWRGRSRSRDQTNQYEGQGVEVFSPLPPVNDLSRIKRQKSGQRQIFGRIAANGNPRENVQNHVRTKTPELENASQRTEPKRTGHLSEKVRKDYMGTKSRLGESSVSMSGARGKTPQPPSNTMIEREVRRQSERIEALTAKNQNQGRQVSTQVGTPNPPSRRLSTEPMSRRTRKTPARNTSKEPPAKKKYPQKPTRNVSQEPNPQEPNENIDFALVIPADPPDEEHIPLVDQIMKQPSASLAIRKLYKSEFSKHLYVPDFLTSTVRTNGEGLPVINYIMTKLLFKTQ